MIGPRVRAKLAAALSITQSEIDAQIGALEAPKTQLALRLLGPKSHEFGSSTFDEIVVGLNHDEVVEVTSRIGVNLRSFRNATEVRRGFSHYVESANFLPIALSTNNSTSEFYSELVTLIRNGDGKIAIDLLERRDKFDRGDDLLGLKVRIAGQISLGNIAVAVEELRLVGDGITSQSNQDELSIFLHCVVYLNNSIRALCANSEVFREVLEVLLGRATHLAHWQLTLGISFVLVDSLLEAAVGRIGILAIADLKRARFLLEQVAAGARQQNDGEADFFARLRLAETEMRLASVMYLSRSDPFMPSLAQSGRSASHYKKFKDIFASLVPEFYRFDYATSGLSQIVQIFLLEVGAPWKAKYDDDPLAYINNFSADTEIQNELRSLANSATQLIRETSFRREFIDAKIKLAVGGLHDYTGFFRLTPESNEEAVQHYLDVESSVQLYYSKPDRLRDYIRKLSQERAWEYDESERRAKDSVKG